MSGRPVIHRAEMVPGKIDLNLALANGDDQPVLRVVQDSASRFLAPGPSLWHPAGEDCDDQFSLRQSPQGRIDRP